MNGPNLNWIFGQRPASPFAAIAGRERRAILGIFSKPDPESIGAKLNRSHLRLLRLRYQQDLTFRQIALATESTEDAVAQMHGRLLDRIQHELADRRILCKEHI